MRLSEEQRRYIIEMLSRGESLPQCYQPLLFPETTHDVTLSYAHKEPVAEILAGTPAATLHLTQTFGGAAEEAWRNRLIHGDNLAVLKSLLQEKQAGALQNADGTPGIRLIYIDPPFSTRQDFHASESQQAYQDRLEGAEFLEFLRKRLALLRELLAENGSIYVHLNWQMSHAVKLLLDEIFGREQFQNDIAWCYREAINSRKRWNRKHDSLLFYSRSETFLFNYDAVRGEYAEGNIRKYRHRDEKGVYRIMGRGITGSPLRSKRDLPVEYETLYPGLTYRHYLGAGTLPVDYWLIDIENQASKARTGYPTQKPEALLERIVRASSNPGDLALDAFAGSGTTCAVAEKLGRRWIAIDSGKLAIQTIQQRMLNLKAEIAQKGKDLTPRPFQLYSTELSE